MELNKDLISNIASVFGVTAEDLTAKLTSDKPEELKLAGQLFTDDELKSRDSSKYNEGKQAQEEMLVKQAKKDLGYDFEGKSFDQLLKYHEEQLKGKYSKNSNERVSELEKDIDKLKKAYEADIEKLNSENQSLSARYKEQENKNYLLSIMPKETALKPEAVITLFNSEFSIDTEEGKKVIKRNGETLKNEKTASPLDVDSVFNDWLVKEKYVTAKPGRGDGNEFGKHGINTKSISEFQKQWQKQNPDDSFNTPKYQEDYAKWRKENKEVTA